MESKIGKMKNAFVIVFILVLPLCGRSFEQSGTNIGLGIGVETGLFGFEVGYKYKEIEFGVGANPLLIYSFYSKYYAVESNYVSGLLLESGRRLIPSFGIGHVFQFGKTGLDLGVSAMYLTESEGDLDIGPIVPFPTLVFKTLF